MKWFKHMSDMSSDVKIKRLIRKFGVEGYGLYNYILELIVRKLDSDSPLPDLEESSNDIAGDLQMDTVKVEEIMLFCIQQGLFEQDEVTGRIVAAKVYKFLQQSETRSQAIRDMISAYKTKKTPEITDNERPGLSETNVKTRLEETTIEEKRGSTRKKRMHVTHDVPIGSAQYNRLCEEYDQHVVDSYILKAKNYCAAKGKKPYADFAAAAENWLTTDKVEKKPKYYDYRTDEVHLMMQEARAAQ